MLLQYTIDDSIQPDKLTVTFDKSINTDRFIFAYPNLQITWYGNTQVPVYIKCAISDKEYIFVQSSIDSICNNTSTITYTIDYLKTWYAKLNDDVKLNCIKSTDNAIWDKTIPDATLPVKCTRNTSHGTISHFSETGSIILCMGATQLRPFSQQINYTVYQLTVDQFKDMQRVLFNIDNAAQILSNVVKCYYLPENLCIQSLRVYTDTGIAYNDASGNINELNIGSDVNILVSKFPEGNVYLENYYMFIMKYNVYDFKDITSTTMLLDIPYIGTVEYPLQYLKMGDNDIYAIYSLDIITGTLSVAFEDRANYAGSVSLPSLQLQSSDYRYNINSTILSHIPQTVNSGAQLIGGNILGGMVQLLNTGVSIANNLYSANTQSLSSYPSNGDFSYIGKRYYGYMISSPQYQYTDREWYSIHGYPVQKIMKKSELNAGVKYWFDMKDYEINIFDKNAIAYIKSAMEGGVVV